MTDHVEHRKQVVALAAGELPESRRGETTLHLGECPECREWLETYRAVACVLGDDRPAALRHPDSEGLARFAVDPASESTSAGLGIHRHLEVCDACRREVALCREAVESTADGFAEAYRARRRLWRMALAAALAAAAVGLALFVPRRPPAEPGSPGAGDLTIANLSIGGPRTIETAGVLVAETSRVLEGADVRLRAGEMVVFGEGFSVDSEAVLVVETRHQQ